MTISNCTEFSCYIWHDDIDKIQLQLNCCTYPVAHHHLLKKHLKCDEETSLKGSSPSPTNCNWNFVYSASHLIDFYLFGLRTRFYVHFSVITQ